MNGLRVVRPGLFSSIQDGGRPGWRRFGVPAAGAWDRGAFALANVLVGNEPGLATIETTLIGGEFEAVGSIAVGLAGALTSARIVSGAIERETSVPCATLMNSGDRLILGSAARGSRTYLSVRGGWQVRAVLGSRSSERRLAAGDFVPSPGCSAFPTLRVRPDLESGDGPIRYVDGIERVEIDPSWEFRVDVDSNRMGLRLEGPAIGWAGAADRRSTPVLPGTIQLAGGRLIVLGIACGTMGGYPQVGQVISADLDRLGQLRPGDRVRLARVELETARRLDGESRRRRAEFLARVASGVAQSSATVTVLSSV